MGVVRSRLAHLALLPVLVLSAVLNLNHLSQNGYANIFYSAGVRSMLGSFHNFLFVSFDPGGLITVDKPPLALWVQAVSAKLFGFHPLSLLVPEAVLGMLCVAALYAVMWRRFGMLAALCGALALAVFPSMVAVSRENGVDPLLILLMILACGSALRAIETGRWLPLIGCAVLIGLAFNTKTLAAYLVVPPIALAYLLCSGGSWQSRIGKLLAAGIVMLAVSFAWILMVELTPASKRPFVGSSTNNTELGLTFSYNGFGRVNGEVGGPGSIPSGNGALGITPITDKSPRHHRTDLRGVSHRHHALAKRHAPIAVKTVSKYLPNGRLRNPIAFERPVGPLRLFGTGLGEQGGWMVPFAFFSLLALALDWLLGAYRRRTNRPRPSATKVTSTAVTGALRDPRLAGLIVLGGWFIVEALTLSLSKGIVHPYYVSALGPGCAAMTGAGAVALARRRDWRLGFVLLAVAGTVAAELVLMDRERYMHWFHPLLIGGAIAGLIAVLCGRRIARAGMVFTVLLLLVVPAAFASTTWLAPVNGTFPAAGPRQAVGYGSYGLSAHSLITTRRLISYASTHQPGTRWDLLTVASDTAAPMILLGYDAGALAGYSGTDPALSGPGLARLVSRHEARYVVLGGAYATRGGNGATAAVQRACREVPSSKWHSKKFTRYSLVLFDCAGRSRQLAQS